MKKILLLAVGLIVTLLGASAQTVLKSIDFADKDSYKGTNGYDKTEKSNDGFWEYSAFNSNNSDWGEIRCGWKTEATTPYVKTLDVLDKDVHYVDVTFGSFYTAANITSAVLQSSYDPEFKTVNAEQNIKGQITKGDKVRFTITKPGLNLYYRLFFAIVKASANGNSVSIKKIELLNDPTIKPTPDISFPESEYSVVLGDLFVTPTLINHNEVEVLYSSSDEDVATVDPATGAITEIKKRGSTIITATSIENENFAAETTSYELFVTLLQPGIHFHETAYTVDLESDNVFPTLVNPNDLPVVFSSSATDVATINSTTGEITIVGAGTTIISASYTEEDDLNRVYEDAEVSYILTVFDNNSAVIFDFVNETYGYEREKDNSTNYLPELAKFENGTVSITYRKEGDGNSKARFWNDGLRVFYENNKEEQKGVVLSIEAIPGFYISTIQANLTGKMSMAFNDAAPIDEQIHKWENETNDPTISKVDLVCYTKSTKAIKTIIVELVPYGVGLTSGGYFTEPVEVLVSGNVNDKKVTVYYADGEDEDKSDQQAFTLDRNATVTVIADGVSLSETYVFSREIAAMGDFNIAYDKDANAYTVNGEVYFDDETEDNNENFIDITPDEYHLYVNGVDMGCWDSADEIIELSNILPNAKFELAVVKHDMNFVATNIFQTVDITEFIEWNWPDNFNPNLKMEVIEGETQIVDHSVVNDVPYVHTALRMHLVDGSVEDLLDTPYEFVIHDAAHKQGYFTLWNYIPLDAPENNYEIHYVVDHKGNPDHATRDDFYNSKEATVAVDATIGFRFIVNQPSSPEAVIRRAPGASVNTEVYYDEANRSQAEYTFASDNSGMSGIENVTVDAGEAVEFFNLQGIRLGSEPASGLYIRRQGGVATKVVR